MRILYPIMSKPTVDDLFPTKKLPFETRQNESKRIVQNYPGRIPIIVGSKDFKIEKRKYLVFDDITVGQLIYVFRKNLKLNPEDAIFIFINNQLPPSSYTIAKLYDESKSEDGFLYIVLTKENTFG